MSQTSLVTYCIQQNEKYELCQSAPVALPVVRKTSNKKYKSPITVCSQKLCMCPTFTMLLLVMNGEVNKREGGGCSAHREPFKALNHK